MRKSRHDRTASDAQTVRLLEAYESEIVKTAAALVLDSELYPRSEEPTSSPEYSPTASSPHSDEGAGRVPALDLPPNAPRPPDQASDSDVSKLGEAGLRSPQHTEPQSSSKLSTSTRPSDHDLSSYRFGSPSPPLTPQIASLPTEMTPTVTPRPSISSSQLESLRSGSLASTLFS